VFNLLFGVDNRKASWETDHQQRSRKAAPVRFDSYSRRFLSVDFGSRKERGACRGSLWAMLGAGVAVAPAGGCANTGNFLGPLPDGSDSPDSVPRL